MTKETSEELFVDVAGFRQVGERDAAVQWDLLGDAEVVDDSEAQGIVGLYICMLKGTIRIQ